MNPRAMFAGDLIAERARITPDRLALVSVESGERLTYADFDQRCQVAANVLATRNIQPGERYGILAHNSIDFLAMFFAYARTGAIAVPLSTRATAHELSQIVSDCGMKVLFHGQEFSEIAQHLPVPSHPLSPLPTAGDPLPRERAVDGEAVACLLYTSGTTGRPKGVMIPGRQLLWNGYNTGLCWGLRDDDVSPIYTPLYHAGGIAAFLIPIFTTGGTIILHKTFEAGEVWRTIEREACTVVLGVPTIWKMLMEEPAFASADLRAVRWFISGGAPLPQFLIEAYGRRGVVMKQGYGMTEVGVNCFTMTAEEAVRKAGSIGRPMMFTEVRLVSDGGEELGEDVIGEMWIRGPHVSSGYWNNPEATAAAYDDQGWFRTGDLARSDGEGFFFIAGRRKEMFITGGVNVYPAEIEAELVSHPDVMDASVLAVPDRNWGEAGVAFVVGSVSEEILSAYLATRLARYKLPKRYVFLATLPRTPYGKVEKETLRELLGQEGSLS
ncbi:MAG: AMP-binding protein [Thermoanaerobaculia bacterium]